MIMGKSSYQCVPIFLFLLLILPSCRDPQKGKLNVKPLTALIDHYESAQGVTLRVKKLDMHDCKTVLGPQSHRLFKKFRRRQPIWPIQLSLTNATNKLIALKPSDIDLPQVSYKLVATRLGNNSFTQIFGTIDSSLLIGSFLAMGSFLALSASGIVLLVTQSFSITAPFAFLGSSALAAIPALLIVGTPVLSTVRGVQTAHNNKTIRQEVKGCCLRELVIVEPHNTIDMIIFVSKPDYQSEFTVEVSHPEDAEEKITFHVSIPSSAHALNPH